jgi:hypothetical protein
MTDQTTPAPIRKSELPTTPPPAWEFHTWFPLPGGGGDLVPGQLSRGVQIRRLVTYGDWEPVRPGRWAEEPPSNAAAPDDQTALRDRIAAAIWERQNPGRRWADCEYRWRADAEADADAVLAVLPAPTDRAGDEVDHAQYEQWLKAAESARDEARLQLARVRAERDYARGRLTDAAIEVVERCPDHGDGEGAWLVCHCEIADRLRRLADETQPTESVRTPCSVPECDVDGTGEPCTRHEREDSHAEGNHELCGRECPAAARQDGPVVTVHAAPDLSPEATEALGALVDVAKQQIQCDFPHPHPEHPCGRRTTAGARQDGAPS